MNGRRSNVEVIADILRMRQAGKTKIMYHVGMSFAQLQKYLDYLVGRDFLTLDSNKFPRPTYLVTEQGEQLLQLIERVEQFLAFGNGNKPAENISQSLATSSSEKKGHLITTT